MGDIHRYIPQKGKWCNKRLACGVVLHTSKRG
jgi:hypothetical protein